MSELGTKIGPHDNWIAATSLVFGIPLLTTNSKEFQRVANLRVIDFLSMT
jgi:predicted nucleic acid-binding protein